MGFIVGHLIALGAVGVVLWMTGASWLRARPALPLPGPRWAGCVLLGALAWTGYLFVLAALGWLGRPGVLAGLALVGLARVVTSRRGEENAMEVEERESPTVEIVRGRIATRLFALLVAALFALLFLVALNPSPAWDAEVYHLTVPKLWLEAGGFVRVPLNVYSLWPMNFQLLYAGAMAAGGHLLATLLHWGAALLLVVLLWRGAGGRVGGAVAAGLLLANELVLFEARAAYADLALALAGLAAFLLLERGLAGEISARALLPAGVVLGWAAGAKPTGALLAIALGLVALAVAARRAGWARGLGAVALGLVLPVALLLAPWLLRSAWETGNPVYPMLHGWLGGPEWGAGLTERLVAWQRGMGMGRSAIDYLLLPWRVVTEGGEGYARFDGRLGPLWLLAVPGAFLAARGRPGVARPLAAAGLLFGLWAAGPQQLRLLLPALPLAALAAGRAVAALDLRLADSRRRSLLAWAAVALLAVALWPATERERARAARIAPPLLARGPEVREMAVPPVMRWVGEHLPADAHLLLVNTNQAFFCPRPCLADSFFEASQIALLLAGAGDAATAAARLRELGVTHLLVDPVPRGAAYPRGLLELAAGVPPAVPIPEAGGPWRLVALR
ncbi:MAG TPA: hypothetical protein VLA75_13865 [Thermoanaerobaculia bacterium]|nr:hypothetical protein [Thermoanaerobaculia bacterium]